MKIKQWIWWIGDPGPGFGNLSRGGCFHRLDPLEGTGNARTTAIACMTCTLECRLGKSKALNRVVSLKEGFGP